MSRAGANLWVVLAFVTLSTTAGPILAQTGEPRELKALKLFAAGEYEKSLALFAELFAEAPHPTYLRNIGRCYQNMGEPTKAIASFREYLRTAKSLPLDKRAEIESYIYEMEQLKNSRAMQDRPPRPPPPPPPAPVPAMTKIELGAAPERGATRSRSDVTPSVLMRWWFWTGVAVVAAGVGGIVYATRARGASGNDIGTLDLRMPLP